MQTAQNFSWSIAGPEIMELPHRLDSTTQEAISRDAMLCIQSGAEHMVLDMQATTLMTASGMRALLSLAGYMKSMGGKLSVCNLQAQPREMFNATGLDAFIAIYPDADAASLAVAA